MASQPQTTQQQRENQQREENSDAIIGVAESDSTERGNTQMPNQGQDNNDDGLVRREPIAQPQRSPQDDARSKIAARFRRAEPENERPFDGDMSNPENIYGVVGADLQIDADVSDEEYDRRAEAVSQTRGKPTVLAEPGDTDGDDEAQPGELDDDLDIEDNRPGAGRRSRQLQQQDDRNAPRMITRVVRGVRVTKSEEEWLDIATKVTAADSYLEETRDLLKGAKELRAARVAPTGQHPDRQIDAQQDGLDEYRTEQQAQHPEPTFRDVVQELQYGDPEEAATKLERLVDARAKKNATEGQLQRSYDQDLVRSQKALKAFSDANVDLANDEIAAMAIERGMYRLYEEDMVSLGLDKDQLPKTPKELANWHRFYRINGYEVRATKDLLNASKENFLKWRDGNKQPAQQQQRPSRQQPRVSINVNRDERRMAIPNQPQRAVTPRRDAQRTVPARGSDVVAQMRQARGQV